MAKGFAIHNAFTDHGGMIPATQMMSSQQGNLFVRAGDGHFCPKCRCWSTVIKSHDHVIFDGKPVAYVGDKLTCGATIMPQQTHVVGSSGSGTSISTATSSFINNKQNTTDSFVDNIKKFEIELTDMRSSPFIPLGVSKFKDFTFFINIKKGNYDAISLEVEHEGTFVEVKKIEKIFTAGQKVNIDWDGFLNNLYDSKFFLKSLGVKFKLKGYSCGACQCSDEKIFQFKYISKDWMDVVINKKSNHILINLRVNLTDGGASGLFNERSVPEITTKLNKIKPYSLRTRSFLQLQQLSLDGIKYYWSRNSSHPTGKFISIDSKKYEVFLKPSLSDSKAMPEMKLTYITNVNPNDFMFRSSNWALSRKTAYATGYLKLENDWYFYKHEYSDKKFKETIAHEIGHAIVETYAGFKESITHHGSSGYNQNPKSGTTYPQSGEIDLMKYAETSLSRTPYWDTRMIANENDVIGLLFISGISRK